MNQRSRPLSRLIRVQALKMVAAAKASHIGGVLSMADVLAVLYAGVLRVRPKSPNWEERDRFILSKGHSCAGLYAVLALRGFFPINELRDYAKDGSRLMAHISHKVPGVEFSTGSLGHGLPFGCGKALAGKRQRKAWRVFVLLSDGELDEGSNWESILFASHHKLDNLVAIVDYNKIQSLGRVDEVLRLDPLKEKFEAFDWNVSEIDGHDHAQILEAFRTADLTKRRPTCIIAHTIKGKGVSFMENQLSWHYRSPNEEDLLSALEELERSE